MNILLNLLTKTAAVVKPYLLYLYIFALLLASIYSFSFGYKLADAKAAKKAEADNKILVTQVTEYVAHVIKKENDLNAEITKIEENLRIKNNEINKKNLTIASLQSATFKLRDEQATCLNRQPDTKIETAPKLGGNEKAGCELSQHVTQFLWNEAGRADTVVNQLSACQDVLRAYDAYISD